MDAPISTSQSRGLGARILLVLSVTWGLALVLSLLLFGLPYVISDCTFGSKTMSVQCGSLTPLFGTALEWYFVAGTVLLGVTPFWLIIGFIVAFVEARRAKTSA